MTLKATLFYGVQNAASKKRAGFSNPEKNRGFKSCSNIFFPLGHLKKSYHTWSP